MARHAADNLNAYRQRLVQERWLSTLILSVHLELEAAMEVLIRKGRLAHGKSTNMRDATFSVKVSQCETLALLDSKVVSCLRAVNKLRNELAHRLDNKPTSTSMYRFIESMSVMHPLSVTEGPDLPTKSLRTFDAIHEHFTGAGAQNLEEFIFISLMLLRATMFMSVDPSIK